MGRESILIDCGEPIDSSLKASGVSHDAIDSIFLSHMHSDHMGGFFMLVQGCWLEGRRKELPVYLPAGAIRPLRAMLQTAFLFDEILNFKLRLLPVRAARPITVGQTRVTAFPTSHLNGFRAMFSKKYNVDFSSHCFLLEAGRRRVGHSGDLGRPEDLAPLLEKPLDLLVCELAHFSPEELFTYLHGRRIKRIVFVHVARPFQESLAVTRRLAGRMLPDIPHRFAHDLEEIRF